MCVGEVMAQYSQRLFRPHRCRPRPIPEVSCSGVRVHPTAAGLSLPLGKVKATRDVISCSTSMPALIVFLRFRVT